jgi:hypothetical protein
MESRASDDTALITNSRKLPEPRGGTISQEMLEELHQDRFRPKPLLALAASTLGWLLLPVTYGIFMVLLGILEAVPFIRDSGFGWLLLMLAGFPFAFLTPWLLRIGNIAYMSRVGASITLFAMVMWCTLPADIIALVLLWNSSNNGSSTLDAKLPAALWWAVGAFAFASLDAKDIAFKSKKTAI